MEFNLKFRGFNWLKRSATKVSSIGNPAQWLLKYLGGESSSGVKVNTRSALKLETVYACISLISDQIGSLPFELYQKTDAGKEKVSGHPLNDLVHFKVNPFMTSGVFLNLMQAKCLTHGNAYAFIDTDNSENAQMLLYLDPDYVDPVLVNQSIYYRIRPHNGIPPQTLHGDYILHIRSFSTNAVAGLSPISALREAIGNELAAQNYHGKFYKNGSFFRGVLSVPGNLEDGRANELSKEFDKNYGGPDNQFRTAVLGNQAKYEPISVPQRDAQFVESKLVSVASISGCFRVPLPLLNHLKDVNNSITENLDTHFVKYCLRIWVKRFEDEFNSKLLTAAQRKSGMYFKGNLDALLRGDVQTRSKFYDTLFYKGAINADEIRAKENMNALPDEMGKKYFNAVNLQDHEMMELQKKILDKVLSEDDK